MSYTSDMFDLSQATAVITGGGGAIGGALGEALLKAGARVVLWGHHQDTLDAQIEKLSAKGDGFTGRLQGVEVDTGDEQGVLGAIRSTEETLGPPTILVNGEDVAPGPHPWKPREEGDGPRCRIYPTPDGTSGVPPEAAVREAIEQALGPEVV